MRPPRRYRKLDEGDLRSFQTFRGTLSVGKNSMPVSFKTRIGDDGEIELDLHAFRITKATRFVRECWNTDRRDFTEFTLHGATEGELRFKSDSLIFTTLGERWSGIHNRHWSKPRGEFSKAQFVQKLDTPIERTMLKLHLKGFECFPPLYSECPLGKINVVGSKNLGEPNEMTGWLAIESNTPVHDCAVWRADVDKLAEHIRRFLSFAASAMLRAPVLEFVHGNCHEVEVLSQPHQYEPVMRVFHKLDQQGVLDAAVANFFSPRIKAKNLFFAIEWFSMASTYSEVRLVNAMTALENLIDSNLIEEETLIEPRRSFDKTRKVLRKVIRGCLDKWSTDRADASREELGEKLLDLNRRSLRRKLDLLAKRWEVPLDGISDAQIKGAIKARNAIVHAGHHSQEVDDSDLWDHMAVVRELVVRFLLTAIDYRGRYLSQTGGYHSAQFPPEAS